MKREHISPLRWLAAAVLFVVATVLYAAVVVYAGEKLGGLGGLVVILALSWPYAWLITLPIREKERGISRAERLRRLRFWGGFDLALLLGGALMLGGAFVGRTVGGDWGAVTGVALVCGAIWVALAASGRRSAGRDEAT
jgi:hypothetical protein